MKKTYPLAILLFAYTIVSGQVKEEIDVPSATILSKNSRTTTDLVFQNTKRVKQNALWTTYNYDSNNPAMAMESEWPYTSSMLPATGIEYDVKYYRLELRINPDTVVGKYISGKITTYYTTNQANFSVVNFDFATPLVCDSVYYHGAKIAAVNISRPTDLLQITIPVIASTGTLDSVSVYYQGVPPAVAAFGGGTGYVKAVHGTNQNFIYTLSEPYASYTWWPCKSFLVNDKADSLDLVVSTPAGFKVAGNGALVAETTIGSNVITYWKHRYPISAYQVCTAVANYIQYPSTPTIVNIGGTNMPLYNYLFPETNTALAEATLDRTALMLTTFSSKFGDYPFKNEKYGHYTFGFSGGMEHNTFSGMSAGTYNDAGDWDIIAHELGHQWFGASVTCGSWRDIWINESFATFSESICAEFAPTVSAGQTGASWRGYHKSLAINPGNQNQPVYVTDTTDITTIFTPAVYVYERGAMVIYMLRALLGDAKFFQAIQNYQSDPLLKYHNAVTDDVRRHMENVSGLNLSTFFNHWIYNKGFASYNAATWNNYGTQIILRLPQTTQSSALSHFDMPLPIRILGDGGDTTVMVYDNDGNLFNVNNGVLTGAGSNTIQYNLSFVPTSVSFDPFNQVLATGSFTKDTLILLAAGIINLTARTDDGNARLLWTIERSADYTSFEVERSADGIRFETIGKVKASDFPGSYKFSFTDANMLPGTGYYRIKAIQREGTVFYTKILSLAGAAGKVHYSILPNPARDYIIIKAVGGSEKITIKIYDAAGKLVKKINKEFSAADNSLTLSLNGFNAGNYYVEIRSGKQWRHTGLVVVVK